VHQHMFTVRVMVKDKCIYVQDMMICLTSLKISGALHLVSTPFQLFESKFRSCWVLMLYTWNLEVAPPRTPNYRGLYLWRIATYKSSNFLMLALWYCHLIDITKICFGKYLADCLPGIHFEVYTVVVFPSYTWYYYLPYALINV
jgi:hypothetical protein